LSDEQEIRDAVDAIKAPGTFNIIQVLQGRGYPEAQVEIYLNESAIYEMSLAKESLDNLDQTVGTKGETDRKKKLRESIMSDLESAKEKVSASLYTVHLMGISEGKREEMYRLATKKYPVEYETDNGLSGLLSGESKREEKDSPERDTLFTDFLWQEHIKKIVNPDGDEQVDFSYATIREMRNTFPLSATIKINEAIGKLRTSTAVFTMETGEDFLAKP